MPVQNDILLQKAVNGDTVAFSALVKEHQNELFNFALSISSGNHAIASDILQEALVKAFLNIKKFNRQSSFKTWLWTIIRREFINFVTRPKTRMVGVELDSDVPVESKQEEKMTEDQRFHALRHLISQLSVSDQEVLVLVDFEERRYDDAAESLGISVSAVKSRLFRARKQLMTLVLENRKLFL